MPRALASLAVAAALLLGACGSDDDGGGGSTGPTTNRAQQPPPRSSPRDEAAVKRTVRRYFQGIADLDGETYCDAFTLDRQEFIANSQSADDCPSGQRKAWAAVRQQVGPQYLRQLRRSYARAVVYKPRIRGDSAQADIEVPEGGRLGTVTLARVVGGWRIDREIELE